jgi:hypothetical protein
MWLSVHVFMRIGWIDGRNELKGSTLKRDVEGG